MSRLCLPTYALLCCDTTCVRSVTHWPYRNTADETLPAMQHRDERQSNAYGTVRPPIRAALLLAAAAVVGRQSPARRHEILLVGHTAGNERLKEQQREETLNTLTEHHMSRRRQQAYQGT
jgi:hypothetical protein